MFRRKKREPEVVEPVVASVSSPSEYVARTSFNGSQYSWTVFLPGKPARQALYGWEDTEDDAIASAKKAIQRDIAMNNYKPVVFTVPIHLET